MIIALCLDGEALLPNPRGFGVGVLECQERGLDVLNPSPIVFMQSHIGKPMCEASAA
jgi:hypothetical protein